MGKPRTRGLIYLVRGERCACARRRARRRHGPSSARRQRTTSADHRDVVEVRRARDVLAHRLGDHRDAAERGVGGVEMLVRAHPAAVEAPVRACMCGRARTAERREVRLLLLGREDRRVVVDDLRDAFARARAARDRLAVDDEVTPALWRQKKHAVAVLLVTPTANSMPMRRRRSRPRRSTAREQGLEPKKIVRAGLPPTGPPFSPPGAHAVEPSSAAQSSGVSAVDGTLRGSRALACAEPPFATGPPSVTSAPVARVIASWCAANEAAAAPVAIGAETPISNRPE